MAQGHGAMVRHRALKGLKVATVGAAYDGLAQVIAAVSCLKDTAWLKTLPALRSPT